MRGTSGRTIATIVAFLIAYLFLSTPLRAQNWQLTVKGNEQALGETPIIVGVKSNIPVGGHVLKKAGDRLEQQMAHVFQEGDRRFLAMILPTVAARQVITYSPIAF